MPACKSRLVGRNIRKVQTRAVVQVKIGFPEPRFKHRSAEGDDWGVRGSWLPREGSANTTDAVPSQQQPISFFSAGGARQEQGSARYAGGCHYRRHATRRRRWAPRFGRGRPPGPPPLSLPGSCGSPPLPAADLYFPCIGELCSSPALAARGKGGQGREQRRPRTPLRVGVSHGGCGGAHRRRSRLQLLAGGD